MRGTGLSSRRSHTLTRKWPPGSSTRNADRKSTRLNSSHSQISYAVFCLKKKKSRSQLRTAPRLEVRYPPQPPAHLRDPLPPGRAPPPADYHQLGGRVRRHCPPQCLLPAL